MFNNYYINYVCEWETWEPLVFGEFSPERGIRQGDPPSRAFLLFKLEYLGKYMSKQKNLGVCIQVTRDTLNISYLMFVDDYLIICRSKKKVAREATHILEHYREVLEQLTI